MTQSGSVSLISYVNDYVVFGGSFTQVLVFVCYYSLHVLELILFFYIRMKTINICNTVY